MKGESKGRGQEIEKGGKGQGKTGEEEGRRQERKDGETGRGHGRGHVNKRRAGRRKRSTEGQTRLPIPDRGQAVRIPILRQNC